MATKNLSRTIIEGGRYNFEKMERKRSIRAERRQAKDFCQKALQDEEADNLIEAYGGKTSYHAQRDKLQPLQRFLEKNVGRGWNNVYSELKGRFDERNIKGYHLLNDHIRENVDGAGGKFQGCPIDPSDGVWGYKAFYIDNNRILRKYPQREARSKDRISDAEYNRMLDFLATRKIMRNGGIICWVEPCDPGKALKVFFGRWRALCWSYLVREWESYPEGTLDYWGREVHGYWKRTTIGETNFRNGRELTATEMAEWNRFSELAQSAMLSESACTSYNDCPSCGQKYNPSRPRCGYCGTEVRT